MQHKINLLKNREKILPQNEPSSKQIIASTDLQKSPEEDVQPTSRQQQKVLDSIEEEGNGRAHQLTDQNTTNEEGGTGRQPFSEQMDMVL